MPIDQKLVKDFLGGDPISGSQALYELLQHGDTAEDELFSRPIEYKTVQVRRRWLRYIAMRKSTLMPRILERLKKGNKFQDQYAAAFFCAAFAPSRELTDELFRRVVADIGLNDPCAADAALTAYGYAGGFSASIYRLIDENKHAWEKLRTFAFRGACASCSRINFDRGWALRQLVTHRWGDEFEIQEISDSPIFSSNHDAIDYAEISLQANGVFSLWRRGEVADQVLHEWSNDAHLHVRWFGAQILSNLRLQRTVRPIIEWFEREQDVNIRAALLIGLEHSDSPEAANFLLDGFEKTQEGASPLARAGWLASDSKRAIKSLDAIVLGSNLSNGAEALVSLARLGSRHSKLDEFLYSQNDYRRLNAMLAVGYLGETTTLPHLTQMHREASTPLERIYSAASVAMFGQPNAALDLHRELQAGAEEEDFDRRVDVFNLHPYLGRAVLKALEAGGQGATTFLDAWREELKPLEPIPSEIRPSSVGNNSEPKKTELIATPVATAPPLDSAQPPDRKPSEVVVGPTEKNTESAPNETMSKVDDGGDTGATDETKSAGDLLTRLGKIGGVAGIALGIFYLLLKPLHFSELDGTAAKLFMFFVFGVTMLSLIVWAVRDRENNKLAGILAVVTVVIVFFGWQVGRNQPGGEDYQVTMDVLKPDGSNATTNEATVSVPGRVVSSNNDGRSWGVHLVATDKGHEIGITAEIPGGGLHARDSVTPSDDHQPLKHLQLIPGGGVDVKVLVIDQNGQSVSDAIVFADSVDGDARTDSNGKATLKTNEPINKVIELRARRGTDELAVEKNYRVGSGAVTLTLTHVGRPIASKAVPTPPQEKKGNQGEKAPSIQVQEPTKIEQDVKTNGGTASANQKQNQQTTVIVNNPPPTSPPPVANLQLTVNSVRIPAWFEVGQGQNFGSSPTSITLKVDEQELKIPVTFRAYKDGKHQISMDSVSKSFSLTKGNHTFGFTVTVDQVERTSTGNHQTVQAPCLKSFTIDTDTEVNPFLTMSNTTVTQCFLLKQRDSIPPRIF